MEDEVVWRVDEAVLDPVDPMPPSKEVSELPPDAEELADAEGDEGEAPWDDTEFADDV